MKRLWLQLRRPVRVLIAVDLVAIVAVLAVSTGAAAVSGHLSLPPFGPAPSPVSEVQEGGEGADQAGGDAGAQDPAVAPQEGEPGGPSSGEPAPTPTSAPAPAPAPAPVPTVTPPQAALPDTTPPALTGGEPALDHAENLARIAALTDIAHEAQAQIDALASELDGLARDLTALQRTGLTATALVEQLTEQMRLLEVRLDEAVRRRDGAVAQILALGGTY